MGTDYTRNMMDDRIEVEIELTDELLDQLHYIANKCHMTIDEFVEEALRQYIDNRKDLK